ncbi:MAG: hypothetical protein K2O18_02745 [Oscillospiraceae bacterium]|nr:hypothetical protein [Oscillospiraceae bacterium]
MMEYRTIFKCRLCGETYEGGCTGNENVALRAVIFACMGKSSEPQAPTLTEAHSCMNGDIGVADFQGFRKVESE